MHIPVAQISINICRSDSSHIEQPAECLTISSISLFWVWTSARAPIYAHDDNRAPKPIQDVGVVPGDEVQKQVVPEDDAVPVDDGNPGGWGGNG